MLSTTTTTINSTDQPNTLNFVKETKGLTFVNGSIHGFVSDKKFNKNEPNLIDLVSDQPKVFVPLTTSLFHLYHDYIGEFLTQYELTPNAKFIIDITHFAETEKLPEYIKMFFKFLNNNNIDYRPINFGMYNKMNINNFYYTNPFSESYEINKPSQRIYEFSQKYIEDKNIPATKKVYLSRKNFHGRDLSFFIKGRLPYEDDNRIDNEELVQEYFRSLGFEIIVPEDFNSFEEQMQYFYQAKMIVSATSSGFINACFMRPGSTMVEIATPLISFNKIGNGVTEPKSTGQEEIHHFYHMMSVAMNHNYISIPNVNRNAEELIEKIKSNQILQNILSE